MRHYARRPVIVGTIAISTLFPLSAMAQSGPVPAHAPRAAVSAVAPSPAAGGATTPEVHHGLLASLATRGGATIATARPPADPVSDGIIYGTLIGAGTGFALMAYMYNLCDGSCDAPEPAPMYLSAAAMGAAVGAVAGWAVDAARRSSGGRVAVGAVVTPK